MVEVEEGNPDTKIDKAGKHFFFSRKEGTICAGTREHPIEPCHYCERLLAIYQRFNNLLLLENHILVVFPSIGGVWIPRRKETFFCEIFYLQLYGVHPVSPKRHLWKLKLPLIKTFC